jgi:hypothetical protein
MTILSFVYRNGILVSVPMFLLGALLLAIFIVHLVGLSAKNQIAKVPLLERQQIEFPEAGPVVLCVEAPRFSGRVRDLAFDLRTGDGLPVEGHRCLFRLTSTGISRTKTELQQYEIPYPGRYILLVGGLAAASHSEHRIVFARPYLLQAVGYILGIILSGWLLIGGLVLFLLRLLARE